MPYCCTGNDRLFLASIENSKDVVLLDCVYQVAFGKVFAFVKVKSD